MRVTKKLCSLLLVCTASAAVATVAANDLTQYLERTVIGPGPEYWPKKDEAIPHVSGDEAFSDTYRFWKDEEAVAQAKAQSRMSHEMNFKDFRWLERSFEGEELVDRGREYFHLENGKQESCASCHGEEAEQIADASARYPAVNERLGRVVTMPTQIAACASERLEQDWVEDTKPNSLITLYLATLVDGVPVQVNVSESPMKEAFERGRDLFFKRTGHFNFACASCHTPPTAGKYLRGQRPTTFFGDAAQYPVYHFPYSLAGDDLEYIFTLQHQIKSCQMLSRMYAGVEGSAPMTDIEVFLKASANDFPVSAPVNFYNLDAGYLAD